MHQSGRYVPATLPDGVEIQVEATGPRWEEDVADLDLTLSFAPVLTTIKSLCDALQGALEAARPSRAEVEFGVTVSVQPGGLTAVLVKGSADASLKVTLEWERQRG